MEDRKNHGYCPECGVELIRGKNHCIRCGISRKKMEQLWAANQTKKFSIDEHQAVLPGIPYVEIDSTVDKDNSTDSSDFLYVPKRQEKTSFSTLENKKRIFIGIVLVISIIFVIAILVVPGSLSNISIFPSVFSTVEEGYCMENPASRGDEVLFKPSDDIHGDFEVKITLLTCIRGEEAWELIEAASFLNMPAPYGYEYVLAKFRFEYLFSSEDMPYDLKGYEFEARKLSGEKYLVPTIVEPDPRLEGIIFPENYVVGWVAYQVDKDDPYPIVSFGADDFLRGGVWIALG